MQKIRANGKETRVALPLEYHNRDQRETDTQTNHAENQWKIKHIYFGKFT